MVRRAWLASYYLLLFSCDYDFFNNALALSKVFLFNMSNLISVIITCYNRAGSIGRTLNSVLSQRDVKVEVIVIDDGSSDESIKVIKQYGRYFPRFKLLSQTNQGQNSAIKLGIKSSTGGFISFIDAGDVWKPDFLFKMISCLRPEDGFIYCWLNNGPRSFLGVGSCFIDVVAQGYLSSMITCLVRKDCFFEDLDLLFPNRYVVCQDDKFCLELSKRFSFSVITECLAYAIPEVNSMTKDFRKNADGYLMLYNDYRDVIFNASYGISPINYHRNIILNLLRCGSLKGCISFCVRERVNLFRLYSPIKILRASFSGFIFRTKLQISNLGVFHD